MFAQSPATKVVQCATCMGQLCVPVQVQSIQCQQCKCVVDLVPYRAADLPEQVGVELNLAQVRLHSMPSTLENSSLLNQLENQTETELEPQIQALSIDQQSSNDLKIWIRAVFRDVRVLRNAFVTDPTAEISVRDPGIDFAAMKEAWQELTKALTEDSCRCLLESIDEFLGRPGIVFRTPADIRALYCLLTFPLLFVTTISASDHQCDFLTAGLVRQAHRVASRLLGLVGSLSNNLHHYLVHWLALNVTVVDDFQQIVDRLNRFINYRVLEYGPQHPGRQYSDDWGMKAVARTMSLLSAANKVRQTVPGLKYLGVSEFYNITLDYVDLLFDYEQWLTFSNAPPNQLAAGRFFFCQYPLLISLGAKMKLLEVSAHRQMNQRVFENITESILMSAQRPGQQAVITPFLHLRIRRDHLIHDSMTQLSRIADNRQLLQRGELQKKLRIEFVGEDGVDAGGLQKEWFLLLVRDLFAKEFGMFTGGGSIWGRFEGTQSQNPVSPDAIQPVSLETEDEEAGLGFIWFNVSRCDFPDSAEEYYLVGLILGLAIYNGTILDVSFPTAVYKKLLRQPVGMQDLRQFRPNLARGLQQLLDYEDEDLEQVFCRDFTVSYESFGSMKIVPLIPDGQSVPVTQVNKQEYVEKYVDWILTKSIANAFDAFQRGFWTVVSTSFMALFQPEEIEYLIRGSAELDILQLKAVTQYDGFSPDDTIIQHFWEIVQAYTPSQQRQLLMFVTGTDRIPATGSASMTLRISCGGEDCNRFPIAHTCFNQLVLYRYESKDKLERLLTRAIEESAGFDIK